jgi:TRAP-type mannitol/chloroaromatic compound transport system substrate-binding protein
MATRALNLPAGELFPTLKVLLAMRARKLEIGHKNRWYFQEHAPIRPFSQRWKVPTRKTY